MSPEIIDLISSSPVRTTPGAPRGTVRPSAPETRTRRAPTTKAISSLPELLSDSWLFSSDISEPLEANFNRHRKRRRIKSPVKGSTRVLSEGPTINEAPTSAQPVSSFNLHDAIHISGPLKDSHSFEDVLSQDATQPNSASQDYHLPLLPSDPFASSPMLIPKRTDVPVAASIESRLDIIASDPFNSSPMLMPKQTGPPVAASIEQRLDTIASDPFNSSPIQVRSANPGFKRTGNANTTANTALNNSSTTKSQSLTAKTAVTGAAAAAAWDPISSSIPEPVMRKEHLPAIARRPSIVSIGDSSSDSASNTSDDDLPELAKFDLSQPQPYSTTSAYTNTYQGKGSVSAISRHTTQARVGSKPKPNTTKQTTQPKDKSGKSAATKLAEKELLKRQRAELQENKRLDKEKAAAIAEVNKARTDRKVSVMAMIVELPASLEAGLKVQVETILESIGVQHSVSEVPIPNLISWKRKIDSRYDDEAGQWVPVARRIQQEHHILKVMTADELVGLAQTDSLDQHMEELRSHYPNEQAIFILEGVMAWQRKNRNIRNRQFTSEVRGQEATASAAPRRRNNQPVQEYVDEDVVEDAMLCLQVEYDVLIHHTAAPLETAQWISAFTTHISTIPYKKQRDEATAIARFCMDSGQVRTGEDVNDTYLKMLQEISRITAPIAYSVANEYSSVSKLVHGLAATGPTALENVKKSANKDGALSDRVIGLAVSRRLYKIFTGQDEMSTEV